MSLDSIPTALAALARGQLIVVVDDENRENEGDLIGAAELATPETIAFMVRHTSGVLCVPLPAERLAALNLPLMVADNSDTQRTAFTITTDLRADALNPITTGISAADRAATVRALVDPARTADHFTRPGHILPLRAAPGGVLRRPGHTEAAIDLARLAGLRAGGVLAEIVNEDGSMARLPQLKVFARQHGLAIITIKDLVAHRRKTERLVQRKTSAKLPTHFGQFSIYGFEETFGGQEHVALVMGDIDGTLHTGDPADAPLVRVHSECMTGEIFGSMRCDCRPQLEDAMARIAADGRGVVIYLRGHEGRGIGLMHKLRAYALQDEGRDTIEANQDLGLPVDSRDYSIGAQMLRDLGVQRMRLMTNNPSKYHGIQDFGLEIVERVPLLSKRTPENAKYLDTKQGLMGHLLGLPQP